MDRCTTSERRAGSVGIAAAILAAIALIAARPFLGTLSHGPMTADAAEWIVRGAPDDPGWSSWVFASDHFSWYRPVAALSYTLSGATAGSSMTGFRALDLGLFLLSIALVAALARALLPRAPTWVVLLTAAAWAWHPAADEMVPFLARRSYVLMHVFGLAALLCLRRAARSPRSRGARLAAGALLALSLGSSEFALGTLAVVPLLSWYWAEPGPDRVRRAALAALLPLLAAGVFLAARTSALRGVGGYALEPGIDRWSDVARPLWLDLTATRALGSGVAAAAGALLLARVAVALGRRGRQAEGALLLAGLWLALVAGACLYAGLWRPRQLAALALPYALTIGALFACAEEARSAARRWSARALPTLLLLGPLLASPALRGQDPARRAEWEGRQRLLDSLAAALETCVEPATVHLVLPNLRPEQPSLPATDGVQLHRSVRLPHYWMEFLLRERDVELRELIYYDPADRPAATCSPDGRIRVAEGVRYHLRRGERFALREAADARTVDAVQRRAPGDRNTYVLCYSGDAASLVLAQGRTGTPARSEPLPFGDDLGDGRSTLRSADLELHAPQLAQLGRSLVLVGLAFDGLSDRVFATQHAQGRWSEPVWLSGGAGALAPCLLQTGSERALVVWPELGAAGWDLWSRELGGDTLGPPARVTADPDPDFQPALALDAAGTPQLVWASLRGGRLDLFRSRLERGAWSAEERLTDRPEPDCEPALGRAPDGALWLAWSGSEAAGGARHTHVRQLAPRLGPTRVLPSDGVDTGPSFFVAQDVLQLVRTRSLRPLKRIGALAEPSCDRWADKRFVLGRVEPDAVRETSVLRMAPNTKATSTVAGRATVVEGPDGAPWILYGETARADRLFKAFQLRLCRLGPDGPERPLELTPQLFGPGDAPAVAWNRRRTRLLVARTVQLDKERETPEGASWIEVTAVTVADLPGRTPRVPPPPPPEEVGSQAAARLPSARDRTSLAGSEWTAWFGNLHLHSDLSRDALGFEGAPWENFLVVRDDVGLDFAMLSDHAEWMLPSDWWRVRQWTELWNEPGRFVTLPGFEWTSLDYGHKNVLFPDADAADRIGPMSSKGSAPEDLWTHLAGERAVVIPHHPSQALSSPTDWSFRNDRYQRLVEIFQRRGSYESDDAPLRAEDGGADYVPGHSVRAALDLGHRLGFVASPDHGGGPGLAGVWAEELTRASLFEALHARRTFASTGARMSLFLSAGDAPMGSEIELAAGSELALATRVRGTAPGLELELIADGVSIGRQAFSGAEADARWTVPPTGRVGESSYYYVRVRQGDGHMGWTSPIWVTRAR